MKALLTILFLMPGLSWGENKIDFKFTSDQNLMTIENGSFAFTKDSDESIKNDDYLNQPITRLDYFLMQFKEELEDIVAMTIEDFNKNYLGVHFKKHIAYGGIEQKRFNERDFDSFVSFNEELGKILIGMKIENIGEPLAPISEACESIIKYNIRYVADEPSDRSNWYQNVILNELYRGDSYRNYDDIFNKIAKNVSFYVSLTSDYDKNFYNVTCYKDNGSDEIKYSTYSFSLD